MNFPNILKTLRKNKGLTQKELAKIINITDSTVSKYERGDLEPNNETLLELANFFNVSIDYMLGRTNVEHPDDLDIITLAAHKVGHTGELTKEEMEKIEMAIKIALLKK